MIPDRQILAHDSKYTNPHWADKLIIWTTSTALLLIHLNSAANKTKPIRNTVAYIFIKELNIKLYFIRFDVTSVSGVVKKYSIFQIIVCFVPSTPLTALRVVSGRWSSTPPFPSLPVWPGASTIQDYLNCTRFCQLQVLDGFLVCWGWAVAGGLCTQHCVTRAGDENTKTLFSLIKPPL